jgi:hypothetical protein
MNLRVYAVVITLTAAGLGVALWQERSANAGLAAQATRLSRQNADLRYEAKQAAEKAEKLGRHAVELDSQLGSAKTRTTATEVRHSQLTRELTAREQREVALMAELATLTQKLAESAIPTAPPTPPIDVSAYRTRIGELEQQLTQLLTRALAEPVTAPAAPPEPAPAPPEPYQVVRVGPRDSFVVLDFGAAHGARPGQILSLWRGTSEVARVQINDARPRFSLAQVLSATLKGQLQTGDLVILTN